MTTTDVLNALANGELDDGLLQIMEAARTRQKKALPELSPGDNARISNLIRPKYIAGLDIKVLSVNRTKAYVRFVVPALAGRYGPECNVPLTVLVKS